MAPRVLDPAGLRARSRVLAAVRRWFDEHGYLEVPTPVRVPTAAMEEHLFPIASEDRWLRTSPELALKRVLAAGLPRVYEIGPCFRGREQGRWHHTEFLMLEWYRVGAQIPDLMDEVEALVAVAAASVGAQSGPWERLTVAQAFAHAGLDLQAVEPEDGSWDTAFFRAWVDQVEPALPRRCFVRDWPASQAALAEVRDDRSPPVAQRFEAYLDGVELANAFLELRDEAEQRRRFAVANAARRAAGEPENAVDEAFCKAVGVLPPVTGIALGIERLVAVLTRAEELACVQV